MADIESAISQYIAPPRFPLELIQNIIYHFVRTSTLKQATSLRLVCHAFDEEATTQLAKARLKEINIPLQNPGSPPSAILDNGIVRIVTPPPRSFVRKLLWICVRDRHKKSSNAFIHHLHLVAGNLFSCLHGTLDTEAQMDRLEDDVWTYILNCYEAYMIPSWLLQSLDDASPLVDKLNVQDTTISIAISACLTNLYPDLFVNYRGMGQKIHTTSSIAPNNPDNLESTPFEIACQKGDAQAVRLMASRLGPIMVPSDRAPQIGEALLKGVVQRGSTPLIRIFIDAANDLTTSDTALGAAVLEAINTNQLDIAALLLDWRLSTSSQQYRGGTCSSIPTRHRHNIANLAVAHNSQLLVEKIIAVPPDLYARKTTRLIFLAAIKDANMHMFTHILLHRGLPTTHHHKDTIKICYAIAEHGRTAMLDKLREAGLALETMHTGASTLIVAAHAGQLPMVQHLLALDVLAAFPFPRRLHALAIQAAAYKSQLAVVSHLLDLADDDLVQDTLLLAVDSGNPAFVHRLLVHGARLDPSMAALFTRDAFARRKNAVQREYEELGLHVVNGMLYKRPPVRRMGNWMSWEPPEDANEVVRLALALAIGDEGAELEADG